MPNSSILKPMVNCNSNGSVSLHKQLKSVAIALACLALLLQGSVCAQSPAEQLNSAAAPVANPAMEYLAYTPRPNDLAISRSEYVNKLHGFWLGQCIANWTGLVTEMDKIGGEGPHGKLIFGTSIRVLCRPISIGYWRMKTALGVPMTTRISSTSINICFCNIRPACSVVSRYAMAG